MEVGWNSFQFHGAVWKREVCCDSYSESGNDCGRGSIDTVLMVAKTNYPPLGIITIDLPSSEPSRRIWDNRIVGAMDISLLDHPIDICRKSLSLSTMGK